MTETLRELSNETLQGLQVQHVEIIGADDVEEGYGSAVIHFNGARLYVDAPTLYVDEVTLTADELNPPPLSDSDR